MRVSQVGIFVLLVFTVVIGTSCNSVIARKNLVDGAQAYKDRKYDKAEELFRDAVQRDPKQDMAQLFLARTLHSQYAANRTLTGKAEEAIVEYKKTIDEYKKTVVDKKSLLTGDRSPCSYSDYEVRKLEGDKKSAFDSFKILGDSLKAVANLLDNLQRGDERIQWLTQWGEDPNLPECLRAEAYNSLAAKENTCANDITDVEPVKKTVTRNGKQEYDFTKPANPQDYEKLKGCVAHGTELINKAVELEKNSDSIWSYKTSLLIQSMRLAEMDGRTADKDRLKTEADQARARFSELAKLKKDKADAEEAEQKAEEEEKENTR